MTDLPYCVYNIVHKNGVLITYFFLFTISAQKYYLAFIVVDVFNDTGTLQNVVTLPLLLQFCVNLCFIHMYYLGSSPLAPQKKEPGFCLFAFTR